MEDKTTIFHNDFRLGIWTTAIFLSVIPWGIFLGSFGMAMQIVGLTINLSVFLQS